MTYAVLFPGQGSQSVGMLSGHADPIVRDTLQEASDLLGWDLLGLTQQGPVEELNRTERTQPALLAASVALWRLWRSRTPAVPAAMAGHSLGEYSALVAAESLAFADALRLVELRGQLMQAAVPPGVGGMTAVVGLEDPQIEALCAQWQGPGVLEPVNYNAPGQVVVAGHVAALDWLEAQAKPAGARMCVRLSMSVPSHCSLMREAAEKLYRYMDTVSIHVPVMPVLHNLDGQPRSDAAAIRLALREQLYRPVRWTQTIQGLGDRGSRLFLECGPGKVLAGLNKRILKEGQVVGLELPEGLDKAIGLMTTG